jgi:hypothetical protein
MAGEVLRMKLIAKFELWCFVSTAVLKSRHYAKPRTVSGKAMTTQPDRQIGFFLMFRILVVA